MNTRNKKKKNTKFPHKYNKEWAREYYKRNKERIKLYAKQHKEQIKENHRRWINKHKEKHNRENREYMRKCRTELRQEIIKLLGNKCIRCGESDWRCLQIDHVRGGGTKERKSMSRMEYYIHIKNLILSGSKKYQLLCANCNWRKKYEEKEF